MLRKHGRWFSFSRYASLPLTFSRCRFSSAAQRHSPARVDATTPPSVDFIQSTARNDGAAPSSSSVARSPRGMPSSSRRASLKGNAVLPPTGSELPPRQRTVLDIPHAYQSFCGVTSAPEFFRRYQHLQPMEALPVVEERVGGRLCGIRHMGGILFLTLASGCETLQVIRRAEDSFSRQDLKALKDQLCVGDIIGAIGWPTRTQKGELSLHASEVRVLAPYRCADQTVCPDLHGFTPLADKDIKYRYRFLDMMTNPETLRNAKKRHAVLRVLRNFLDNKGFVEVETPMLHEVASGANAKPFTTYHEGNDATLFLRVAPELYLKQCVVGGMERVYEIGRVFRNEDADRHHNPEFTSCELYSAFDTYEELIPLTEDLLRRLAMAANGTTEVTVNSIVTNEKVTIDLSKPFHRVSAYEAVESAAGVKLPPSQELNTPRGLAYLSAILLRYNIPFPAVRTASKMFDKLIQFFITDRVVMPTFVTDHPVCMSPLAKAHKDQPGLSERFELFINGVEYCNAYSELNDPEEQFFRFQQQLMDKRTGDEEAMNVDETFLKALQVGLPPTAGWGLGLDRLMSFLQGSSTIRDTILYPLLRSDSTSRDGKRRRKTAANFAFNPKATTFVLHCLEEEMKRSGMSSKGCERIRELHELVLQMQRRGKTSTIELVDSTTDTPASNKWREDMTMVILQVFCGRSTK